jgi:hypothetical protein
MSAESMVQALLDSPEPAIRFRIRTGYLGEDPNARSIRALRNEVRHSPLVASLFRRRGRDGRISGKVYAKWQGAHWIMATLADIGYPSGDRRLHPLRDQIQEHWLDERFYRDFPAASRAQAYAGEGVPIMEGRHRRCASQQANALWSILKLGIANGRTHDLVERLLYWQWPDGGWPAEKRYYKTSSALVLGNDYVDWGGTSKKRSNPWVTTDALYVLKAGGRQA